LSSVQPAISSNTCPATMHRAAPGRRPAQPGGHLGGAQPPNHNASRCGVATMMLVGRGGARANQGWCKGVQRSTVALKFLWVRPPWPTVQGRLLQPSPGGMHVTVCEDRLRHCLLLGGSGGLDHVRGREASSLSAGRRCGL
jgi:hypothetical protein